MVKVLAVQGLPWGDGEFRFERYRLTETEDWAETESIGHGPTAEISSRLPAPGLELVVIRPG
ncbi:MAG: hypothetical protein NTW86_08580 [Candidatus Sumerlaeota bacterium]|nr:hypothetical protein [Candidatus Sumerlaeota bacterium]